MIVPLVVIGTIMIISGIIAAVFFLSDGNPGGILFVLLAIFGVVFLVSGLTTDENGACGKGYKYVELDKTITTGEYKIPAGWEGCVKL